MRFSFYITAILLVVFTSCKKDKDETQINTGTGCSSIDLSGYPYSFTAFTVPVPSNWPVMPIPADNPLSTEKIELGRMLFFDPILSSDSTISCASCHEPSIGFSDARAKSIGVNFALGQRQSMSIVNVAYQKRFFWDGRAFNPANPAKSLEEQVFHPVPNPVEMNNPWANVANKLQNTERYYPYFKKAFNIQEVCEIDSVLVAKAIASFERTLVSYNSKMDRVLRGEDIFSESESNGYEIFTTDFSFSGNKNEDFECWHCHGRPQDDPVFTPRDLFFNNGLTAAATVNDFPDLGLGGVSNNANDNGLFKVPSLRNIANTAPYMHNAAFSTLDQVLDFYIASPNNSPTKSANLHPIINVDLNPARKQDVINFLKTLTDTTYLNNPDFKSPF